MVQTQPAGQVGEPDIYGHQSFEDYIPEVLESRLSGKSTFRTTSPT